MIKENDDIIKKFENRKNELFDDMYKSIKNDIVNKRLWFVDTYESFKETFSVIVEDKLNLSKEEREKLFDYFDEEDIISESREYIFDKLENNKSIENFFIDEDKIYVNKEVFKKYDKNETDYLYHELGIGDCCSEYYIKIVETMDDKLIFDLCVGFNNDYQDGKWTEYAGTRFLNVSDNYDHLKTIENDISIERVKNLVENGIDFKDEFRNTEVKFEKYKRKNNISFKDNTLIIESFEDNIKNIKNNLKGLGYDFKENSKNIKKHKEKER